MVGFNISSKKIIIGSWLNTGSTAVAELMAESGLDFVTIDMEHAPISIESLADLLRAIRSGNPNCIALVRTPGHEYQDLKRYMDAGAHGVIVPFVSDAFTAQAIVNAAKRYVRFDGSSMTCNNMELIYPLLIKQLSF